MLLSVFDYRYYLQGNKSMDTRENLLKRNALRADTRVKRAVQMIWDMFPKTPEFQVQKNDYISFLVRVVKLVIPEFNAKEARATAEVCPLEHRTASSCQRSP